MSSAAAATAATSTPAARPGVRESHDELVDGGRRAVPRDPSADHLGRGGYTGRPKTSEAPRLETLGGLRAFASGADPAWTA